MLDWLGRAAGWERRDGVETVALARVGAISIEKKSDGLLLNGVVQGVPWAGLSQRIIMLIETGTQPVIVQLDPATIEISQNANLAGEPRDTLILRDVSVDGNEWCWSPVGVLDTRLRGSLMRTIQMAGAATAVLDMTVEYSLSRNQFGRPISKFQAVQQLIAQLAGEVSAAVTSARTAAADGATRFETASAAVRVSQSATKVSRIAHQIHGAIGITQEYPLSRYTNRLKSWRSEFGSESEWSRLVVNTVLSEGSMTQLWTFLTSEGMNSNDE